MSWNYRVVKADTDDGESWLSISEVYYNKNGEICGMSEDAACPNGETVDELRGVLQMMLASLDKPVLSEGGVVFADWDEETKGA